MIKKLPSLTKVPLGEKVYIALLESIMSGDIPLGSELKEQHISEQLSVSATPVREAFKRLASEGIIEIEPYKGAVVKSLNMEEIVEAYACREALEHLAVKEVILKADKTNIAALYSIMEEYDNASSVDDYMTFSQGFDDYIYQLAGNRALISLLDSLRMIIYRDRRYSLTDEKRKNEIYFEHKKIIEAIEAKDITMAQEAISYHIQMGLSYIKEKVD